MLLVYNCLLPNCSWGGPLSQNWLDQQLCLQKQILSRMLELGMTPGKLKIPNRNSYWLQFSCNVMHKQGIQDDSLGIYLTQKYEIKSYLKRWNFISHAPSQSNNVADQMYSPLCSSAAIILWKCSSCFEEDFSFSKYNETWRLVLFFP